MTEFFKMSFHFKKVTSGLPFYISQPKMDKRAYVKDVLH